MYNHYQRAKKEGRLCTNCGWFISKKRWSKGERLCEHCKDALRGVSGNDANNRHGPYRDEPLDMIER